VGSADGARSDGGGAGAPPEHHGPIEDLVERARRLAVPGRRRILGITGPPGAGKSMLAGALAEALGADAALVPMDGFHLANAELVRLGRRDRKGAPDTFDAAGYAALLGRLRAPGEDVVYAPDFRREIEEPVAGAIPVAPRVPLVLTEGNYLLLDARPWSRLRALLDQVWYLESEDEFRIPRLVARHIEYGKSPAEARAWVMGSDQRNAQVVAETRARADLVVRLEPRRRPR
jgi:pantothenate kinase